MPLGDGPQSCRFCGAELLSYTVECQYCGRNTPSGNPGIEIQPGLRIKATTRRLMPFDDPYGDYCREAETKKPGS